MLRRGSRVYHRVFGAGNITVMFHDYAEVAFDKSGKRVIAYSALSEKPFDALPTKTVVANKPFALNSVVYNAKYGKGIIKALFDTYALVSFEEIGDKKIKYEALSKNSTEFKKKANIEEPKKQNEITLLNVLVLVMNHMKEMSKTSLPYNECEKFVKEELSWFLSSEFIRKALDPINEFVFVTHLIKREAKIYKGNIDNISVIVDFNEADKKVETINPPVKKDLVSHFEKAALEDTIPSTIKLYFARAIIEFCREVKICGDDDPVYLLSDLAKYILKAYLYQRSIGDFQNGIVAKQPDFYKEILERTKKNSLSEEDEKVLINKVAIELNSKHINQFLSSASGKGENIYIPLADRLIMSRDFVVALKPRADELEGRLLSRLFYFLKKINSNQAGIKAYESNIRRGLDKKDFIIRFEYEENLNELKKHLDSDFYLKTDFKALMRKYGIPQNEKYLNVCLDKLDYSLKTKRIILSSKYPNLKSYYKEQILVDDVYRYSNPLNLDEYDTALKALQYDLVIIDVGNGSYLTRINMEKNGVNDTTIAKFHKEVEKIGNELRFFSTKELSEILITDPIVEYCGGDKKQLLQFVKPIPNIQIIQIGTKGEILSFTISKKYRAEFIDFILGKNKSMDIYEIHDFVESVFDIEYPLDEIIKDIKQTDFYYSEEMEKVYKHKEDFIKEIYYDDD